MSFSPHPERVALPALESTPARAPFPIVATIAPVGIAIAVWAVTGSGFALLFALLGPVVALAGLLDSRLHARRGRRAAEERVLVALAAVGDRLEARGRRERERLDALAPAVDRLGVGDLPSVVGDVPLPVRLGSGGLPDAVEFDGDPAEGASAAIRDVVVRMRASAARLPDAPVVVDGRGGVAVHGPAPAAHAFARGLELQLRARRVPSGSVALVVAETPDAIPAACAVVVAVGAGGPRIERPPSLAEIAGFAPQFASRAQERRIAALLDGNALPGKQAPPDRVALGELLAAEAAGPREGAPASGSGLAAPIGSDAHGPVWLDLVAQGPHALISGTTGSGKSELLVTWVVGLAARHPTERLTFLLIDFKGGAAFAPLAGLPHVTGTLSDLDGRLTARAVESLRAELRRRERLLADRSARSIDELPPGMLARLVIVVDEFAAVVGEHPELQPVFADLAARGRSLGLHLVLCTQRPSGVVRDAVLANITLRVSLRVTDRADSIAVVGTDAAAALPLDPPGRALVADGTGTRLVQLALAGPSDIAAVRDRAGRRGTSRPWLDPLPERIPLASVPDDDAGYAFGLVDLPAEQQQPPAVHVPGRHGALLVLGATGSGKTTALATLAARAGRHAVRLASEPADAWQLVAELLATSRRRPGNRLVVADDLDVLLGGFDGDHRADAIELFARLAREGPAIGIDLAASAQSLATMHALSASFGSRLLLRLPSREEHVLAGGDGARFDPAAPPGSGTWRGSIVQVAIGDGPAAGPIRPPEVAVVAFETDTPTAVVSGRPRELRALLLASGARVVELGASAGDPADELRVASGAAPTVLLGDPDAWHADWATLGRARREWPIVVHAATVADYRALTRARQPPPPLGRRPGECWFIRDGVTSRAVLPSGPRTR